MKEVLQTWLENTIDIATDLDSVTQNLKDGMLLIRILKHYNAVNINSIKNVFPSSDDAICRNNLVQLKIWFRLIDIDFSDDVINKIIESDSSSVVDILYKLYLAFEHNNILPMVTKQKERNIKKDCGKFKVTKVSLVDAKDDDSQIIYVNKKHEHKTLIEWYENKYDKRKQKWVCPTKNVNVTDPSLSNVDITSVSVSQSSRQKSILKKMSPEMVRRKEDIHYVREELNKYSKSDETVEFQDLSEYCINKATGKFVNSDPSDSYFTTCTQNLPPIFGEYRLPQHVKEYMRKLKSNAGFSCKRRHFTNFCTSAIGSIWNVLLDREKVDLKSVISSRILKQSLYEKELAAKLISIRKQHNVQKMCYIDLENELVRSRKSIVSVNVLSSHASSDINPSSYNINKDDDDNDDEISEKSSSYLNKFSQRYKFNFLNIYLQNEKKRTAELHTKLYAEKLKLQFERHYAVCLHAVEDMIELAIRKSEFKSKFGFDVPSFIWSDWKCLLHNNQSITDFLGVLKLMLYPDYNNIEIVSELVRQDLLNENNLDMYLQEIDDWSFGKSDDAEEEEDYETEYQNIVDVESQIPLGYAVHRVLEKKYPLPPQTQPANLTKLPIMAVINGIEDVDAIQNLKNILEKVDVLVVDVKSAVNFCLQRFKDEFGENVNVFSNDISDTLESFNVHDDNKVMTNDEFMSQFTQTGSSLLDVNVNYSTDDGALVGNLIFNKMLFGNEIPFDILVNAVIQFIQHKQEGLKGWVLVNSPSTMYQASLLEHALSGKKFPFQMEDDLNASSESECKISDTNKEALLDTAYDVEVKCSRIVPNPTLMNDNGTFRTYFTMYVSMVKGSTPSNNINDYKLSEWDGSLSDSTILLEQPEKEGIPTLHSFYRNQGVGYDFIYEQFDFNAMKQLARVFICKYLEDAKRLKTTDTLFNEELLKEFDTSVILKWNSQARFSMDGSSLFRSTKTQSVSVDNYEYISQEDTDTLQKVERHNWQFTNFPIADNVIRTLASFWEAIENVYLSDLKEVFFVKRQSDYTCLPYVLFITNQFNALFQKEDDRQNIVTEFLDAYNSIHQVLRSNSDLKNELHLRVLELSEKLTSVCREKYEEMNDMILALINQNWTYHEMALCSNCFITLIQVELDRLVRTLEFLKSYYLAMLEIYVSEPVPYIKILTFDVYSGEEVEEEIIDEELFEDGIGEEEEEEEEEEEAKIVRFTKRISINLNIDEIDDDLYKSVIERLKNYEEFQGTETIFYAEFAKKVNACFEDVLKVKSQVVGLMEKEKTVALKKLQDQFKINSPPPKDTKQSSKKSRKDKVESPSGVQDNIQHANANNDYEIKKTQLKSMFEEWNSAVNSEIERFSFKVELIKRKLQYEYNITEDLLGNMFAQFYDSINDRFLDEVVKIDRLCNLFQVAIEEKTPINVKIIFKLDTFYVIKPHVENPEVPLKLPIPLEELSQEDCFTVRQLEVIKKRLEILAPSGIITRGALVKFIDSVICYSSSLDNIKLVPGLWSKLGHNDLDLLFERIFGIYSIIEWRDFLILCLELSFPLTEDIIDAKLQLSVHDLDGSELITHENYMKSVLWFEREVPKNPIMALHNIRAKEFLFTLFQTSDYLFNYTSFLLAFCRDVDPQVGLGKTLSLMMGKCVIVYKEDLYLEEILTDHIDTNVKVAKDILGEIINDVVRNSLSGKQDITTADDNIAERIETSFFDINLGLSEETYYQYFRKFSTLQWISRVPRTLITTVLCVVFYSMFKPEYFFLYPDICIEIDKLLVDSNTEDIFVPEFVNNRWLKEMYNQVRKFTAFSLKDIVNDFVNPNKNS